MGAPGCSFCLGIAADVAGENEVWLSSQNRNYRNRMGKGSIANLASAITVAASSFTMEVTDPTPFLKLIDVEKFNSAVPKQPSVPITIAEVAPELPVAGEEAGNADAEAAASLETFSAPSRAASRSSVTTSTRTPFCLVSSCARTTWRLWARSRSCTRTRTSVTR